MQNSAWSQDGNTVNSVIVQSITIILRINLFNVKSGIFTARVYGTMEMYCFYRSVHTQGGYPISIPIILPLVSCPFLGVPQWLVPSPFGGVPWPGQDDGYPGQVRMGYPGQGWGIPWPGMGYPKPGTGYLHPEMGYSLARDGVSPWQGMGYHQPGWGTPPIQRWGTPWPGMGYPQDRTTDGVLDTRQAVCLLRSRRRTVLCYCWFSHSRWLRMHNLTVISNLTNCFSFSPKTWPLRRVYRQYRTLSLILNRRERYAPITQRMQHLT